jgi:polar amino acid transport system permease protein
MLGLTEADLTLFLQGAAAAVALFAVSVLTGIVVGVPLGLVRAGAPMRGTRLLRPLATGYSAIFRGVPLIVQFLYIYYAPYAFGLQLDRFSASVLALTGYASASMSEIVKAAVDSVPRGQWLAARSIGMTYPQVMRYVVGPQSLAIAIPPSVGFAAQLIKGTSIASVVGIFELTFAASVVANRSGKPLLAYMAVGVCYFVLTFPVSFLARRLEKGVRVNG